MKVSKALLTGIANEKHVSAALRTAGEKPESIHQQCNEIRTVIPASRTMKSVTVNTHLKVLSVRKNDICMSSEDIIFRIRINYIRDNDILRIISLGLDSFLLQPLHDEADTPVFVMGRGWYYTDIFQKLNSSVVVQIGEITFFWHSMNFNPVSDHQQSY